jgi:putative ABC transport system permease protein
MNLSYHAHPMNLIRQDIGYALRQLRRSPGFTAAVVLTLALGIGANSVMLGVVDTLLLSPPAGVTGADRLRRVYVTDSKAGPAPASTLSVPDYEALRDGTPSFERVAAYTRSEVPVGRGRDAHPVQASLVTAEYFTLLGVRPALGRLFSPEEARAGGARVAVLGHGYWQRRFGADSGVVGRTLRVGQGTYTVVGVAASGFTGADLRSAELWLPIYAAAPDFMDGGLTRDVSWVQVLARLRPGALSATAAAEATVAYRRGLSSADVRGRDASGRDAPATVTFGAIQEARGPEASRESRVAVWVAAVAGLVLLIACANVANLLLARALARRPELAVRMALGAGRGALARQLLVESLLLGLLGSAAAILVALWAGPAVRALVLPAGAALSVPLDWRFLLLTVGLGLLTGVLAGILPALEGGGTGVGDAIRAGSRTGGARSQRVRTALILGQVTLTAVLLVGAGLFLRSLRAVQELDLGLDLDRTLMVEADLERAGISKARLPALREAMLAQAAATPGVAHAALSQGGPFSHGAGTGVRVPGLDSVVRPSRRLGPFYFAVTPGYFEAMGTEVIAGRAFSEQDRAGAAPVAIVNRTMARLLWPGQAAIGRCFYMESDSTGTCREVVGVVEDSRRRSVLEEPQMLFYAPLAQLGEAAAHQTLYLRVADGVRPAELVGPLRQALAAAAPDLPYLDVRPLAEVVAPQLGSWRLGATMFTAFGGLALAVAALGLYSMLAYVVTQRTREIGLRMALGAREREVVGLVLRQGMVPAVGGAVLGGGLGFGAARYAAGLLYGVGPGDPAAFVAAGATLLTVTLAAALVPALRATQVDPMTALRVE